MLALTPRSLKRFVQYSLLGFGTFLLDILLLYVLKEYVGINYLIATAIGFIVGVSLNYVLSRKYVFHGSERSYRAGYGYFFLIAGVGLAFISVGMYVLVTVLSLNYLFSRVGIAALVGIWNYTMNLFFNFKVAETLR